MFSSVEFRYMGFPRNQGSDQSGFQKPAVQLITPTNQLANVLNENIVYLFNYLEVYLRYYILQLANIHADNKIELSFLTLHLVEMCIVNCEPALTLLRVFQCWVQEGSGGPTEKTHPEK